MCNTARTWFARSVLRNLAPRGDTKTNRQPVTSKCAIHIYEPKCSKSDFTIVNIYILPPHKKYRLEHVLFI